MYDPCIGDCGLVQNFYPTYQFALNNNEILNLNQSTIAEMERISSDPKCGMTEVSLDSLHVA